MSYHKIETFRALRLPQAVCKNIRVLMDATVEEKQLPPKVIVNVIAEGLLFSNTFTGYTSSC